MIYWDDLVNSESRDIIKLLIKIRKYYDITSCSSVNIINADTDNYVAEIDNLLKVVIGDTNDIDGKILFQAKSSWQKTLCF